MRALTIDDPDAARGGRRLCRRRSLPSPVREGEIAKLDKDVLGTEGRLIGRVTELLREVSARRGRVLSRDFARTLAEAKWQSIVLGTLGVLIGHVRGAASWSAAPCGRWRRSRRSIRALAGGEKDASIPAPMSTTRSATSRAPPKCSAARWSTPTPRARRRCARSAEQRLAEESYRKLFEASVDGIYVTTPAGALLNANPALARMMGYDTPEDLISGISDVADTVYVHPAAREEYQRLMQRDGMVREFEYQVRAARRRRSSGSPTAPPSCATRTARSSAMRARCATSPTRSAPKTRSPKAAGCCSR